MRVPAPTPDQTRPPQRLIGVLLLVLGVGLISPVPASTADPATAGAEGSPDSQPVQQTATWLGVSILNLTPTMATTFRLDEAGGVLVTDVVSGSPAKEAGLRLFDVVLEIDGRPIGDTDELCSVVRDHTPGRKVELKIWRDGSPHHVVATLAAHTFVADTRDHPEVESPPRLGAGGPLLGVTVMPLEKGLARYFKTKPGKGVLVTEVAGHSPAEQAGFELGDVILVAGDEQIGSVADLRKALSAESDDKIELIILREGKRRTLSADLTMPGWRRPHAYWLPGPQGPVLERELDALRRELEHLRQELKDIGDKIGERLDEPDD